MMLFGRVMLLLGRRLSEERETSEPKRMLGAFLKSKSRM